MTKPTMPDFTHEPDDGEQYWRTTNISGNQNAYHTDKECIERGGGTPTKFHPETRNMDNWGLCHRCAGNVGGNTGGGEWREINQRLKQPTTGGDD